MRRLVLLTLTAAAITASPATATESAPPQRQGAEIVRLVQSMSRDTPLRLIDQVTLQGETWHPQGIARVGDEWVLSTVEVTEWPTKFPDGPRDGFDRTTGAGVGHLLRFAADGTRLADRRLAGDRPDEYHPGGLDYDGRALWVTLSQYRPSSTATVMRVDSRRLRPRTVATVDDHLGGIVHDTARRRLVTLNWGSRAGLTFRVAPSGTGAVAPLRKIVNPTSFIDYQDCKYLGRPRPLADPLMLCGGVAAYGTFQLGGIALVNTRTLQPVHEVPITAQTPAGRVLTGNPIDVSVVDGKLRLHFAPDDDATTVYTYEAGA